MSSRTGIALSFGKIFVAHLSCRGSGYWVRSATALRSSTNFGTRITELDTHASLLAKKGVPLEVVSKRLGHADIRITAERYLHFYRESDAAAARVLDTVASFDFAPTALRSG